MDLKILTYVSQKINETGILWCIGGSILLYLNNIIKNPRDIDILVNEDDAPRLHQLLLPLGEYKSLPSKEPYLTKYFYNHKINDIEVDIIGGFKIKHSDGIYDFILDKDSISIYEYIDDTKLPLSTLEDWYVLYQLIPDREEKVSLLERHFLNYGLERPQILKKALTKELPLSVRKRIEGCLIQFSR